MIRTQRVLIVLLCIAAFVTIAGGAAEARTWHKIRKAEQVIRKHVRALGGKGNLRKIRDMRVDGRLESMGFEFDFTIWLRRPNQSFMELSIQGMDVIQAYDGETAWWVNPLAGASSPRRMPAELAQSVIRWSDFDGPLVNYRHKHHKAVYIGEHTLRDGTLTHHIELRLAGGDVWQVYIDKETYLEVARSYEQTFRGTASDVMTYFSEFREIDGVVTPTVVKGTDPRGAPYTMVFESFEPNVGIDENRFVMP